jgi:hypothetical protein
MSIHPINRRPDGGFTLGKTRETLSNRKNRDYIRDWNRDRVRD